MEHLHDDNFEAETKSGVVLVDLFATWCGPCRMLAPIVEQISEEIEDVKFVKVDVDECPATARKFGVMSIPTLILLKDGREVAKHVGLMSHDDLVDFVNDNK